MQTKAVAFEVTEFKRDEGQDAIIEGYASVYDVVDSGLDIVAPGAFSKSISGGRKVRMLWQHDMSSPIGVWDEMRDDAKGLFVKGRISRDVQRGAEAIALFRMGAMDSLSIGYRTVKAEPEGGGRIRKITEAELWEVSAVTIPMNEHATAQVKAAHWETKRDLEVGLRDVFRLSQAEAKAFMADGYAGLARKRDVSPAEAETESAKALFDQIRQLQEKFTNV